jgi:hypothetical protein
VSVTVVASRFGRFILPDGSSRGSVGPGSYDMNLVLVCVSLTQNVLHLVKCD